MAEGTVAALKADNEEKDKLIRTLFELVEGRKTIDSDHNESIEGEGTCDAVRVNHDELTRANVEGNAFDKDLDAMYDAAKRTGEEDRASEDNEEDRALNNSEEGRR